MCVYYNINVDASVDATSEVPLPENVEDFILIITYDCKKTNELLNIANRDIQFNCDNNMIGTSDFTDKAKNLFNQAKVLGPQNLVGLKQYRFNGTAFDTKRSQNFIINGYNKVENNKFFIDRKELIVKNLVKNRDLPVHDDVKRKHFDEMIKAFKNNSNNQGATSLNNEFSMTNYNSLNGGKRTKRTKKRPNRKRKSTKRRRGTRKRTNKKR